MNSHGSVNSIRALLHRLLLLLQSPKGNPRLCMPSRFTCLQSLHTLSVFYFLRPLVSMKLNRASLHLRVLFMIPLCLSICGDGQPFALSMAFSLLGVSEASFVGSNLTLGIIGNDPQHCDTSIASDNDPGSTTSFAGGNSECLPTALTCSCQRRHSCENCLRTLSSNLSNALVLVVSNAGMMNGSATCSQASGKSLQHMPPSSPHSRILL